MSELILYNYPMSPFSEKIRRMLGYTGLAWQSVGVREMPPRPVLEKLVGGYRKIPVAQIGADVFCDTRTIATELARLAERPALALENCDEAVQDYVARADLELFFACLMTSSTLELNRKVLKAMSILDIGRFIWDRIKIGRKASVPMIGLREAKSMMREHLEFLEGRLAEGFLFGPEPNHADFSTYHSLWFARDLANSKKLNAYPHVLGWMDRMQAFGEGQRTEITAEDALQQARQATPRPIPGEHVIDPLIGKVVHIAPADYAQVATTGTLVGSSPTQWILAREHEELGAVHVHFPRQGFRLQPV